MLLNVPPDQEGLVYKTDSMHLKLFGDILKETFAYDLAKGATAIASNVRGEDNKDFGPQNLFDGDQFSYWSTDDAVHTPELTIQLKGKKTFDIIRLKENTKLGQRIDSLVIDAWLEGGWQTVASASSIGSNRLLRLPAAITTQRLRIRIIGSPVCPALSDVSLFRQSPLVEKLQKEAEASAADPAARHPKADDWTVISPADSKRDVDPITDGKPATLWQARRAGPVSVVLDAGKSRMVSGLDYLPPASGAGAIDQYAVYISNDGAVWQKIASGEFANIQANPVLQSVRFNTPVTTRYIRLEALHTVDGKPAAIAALNVL